MRLSEPKTEQLIPESARPAEDLLMDRDLPVVGSAVLDLAAEPTVSYLETNNNGQPLKWETAQDGDKTLNYLPSNNWLTDLPTFCFGTRQTEGGSKPDRISLLPTAIDRLDAGEYRIRDDRGSYYVLYVEKPTDGRGTFFGLYVDIGNQTLKTPRRDQVVADDGDKNAEFVSSIENVDYLNDAASYFGSLSSSPRSIGHAQILRKSMLDFGYKQTNFRGKEVLLAPSPLTMQRLASLHGVPIRLIDSTNDKATNKFYSNAIPVVEYIDAFKHGEYPIGIRDLCYYGHDLDFDHFASVLALGNNLMQVLSDAVIAMDEGGHIDGAVDYLDEATSRLTHQLSKLKPDNVKAIVFLLGKSDRQYRDLWDHYPEVKEPFPFSKLAMDKFYDLTRDRKNRHLKVALDNIKPIVDRDRQTYRVTAYRTSIAPR